MSNEQNQLKIQKLIDKAFRDSKLTGTEAREIGNFALPLGYQQGYINNRIKNAAALLIQSGKTVQVGSTAQRVTGLSDSAFNRINNGKITVDDTELRPDQIFTPEELRRQEEENKPKPKPKPEDDVEPDNESTYVEPDSVDYEDGDTWKEAAFTPIEKKWAEFTKQEGRDGFHPLVESNVNRLQVDLSHRQQDDFKEGLASNYLTAVKNNDVDSFMERLQAPLTNQIEDGIKSDPFNVFKRNQKGDYSFQLPTKQQMIQNQHRTELTSTSRKLGAENKTTKEYLKSAKEMPAYARKVSINNALDKYNKSGKELLSINRRTDDQLRDDIPDIKSLAPRVKAVEVSKPVATSPTFKNTKLK